MSSCSALVEELIRFPKCLAAAINGHAFGLAVTILPLHDLVFALPGRVRIALAASSLPAADATPQTFKTPFAELGVCAEGCSSVTFPRILGPALTTKMMMLSEPQTAETLAARGFLSVVPDATPDSLRACQIAVDLVDRCTDAPLPLPAEYALSFLAERFGIPECAADPDTVVESADYTNLSLESMMATKRLVSAHACAPARRKIDARFLTAAVRRGAGAPACGQCTRDGGARKGAWRSSKRRIRPQLTALSQIAASPVFLAGVSRFLAKQQAKKAAAASARL
jgi:enoyl-CoA hydratase/carnithine racemase